MNDCRPTSLRTAALILLLLGSIILPVVGESPLSLPDTFDRAAAVGPQQDTSFLLRRAAAARRVEQARVALAAVLSQRSDQGEGRNERLVSAVRADVARAERAFEAVQSRPILLVATDKPKTGTTPVPADQSKAQAERAYAARVAAAEARTVYEKAASALSAKRTAAKKATDAAQAARLASEKKPEDRSLKEKAGQAAQAADISAKETAAAEAAVAAARDALYATQEAAAAAEAVALGGLKPITADQWDYARARHFLFRAGFGGTPEEVAKLVAVGPYDAVDSLVNYHLQPLLNLEFSPFRVERAPAYERHLARGVHEKLSEQRRALERKQQPEMRRWWLRRMAESPRPLQEKLTLFWHDHFAVNYHNSERVHLVFKQNELFRAYAGENFAALLHGIVQDPAMIQYLDNHMNINKSGNENLGRELQELFSIGEEYSANHTKDGYNEQDVREASRALTGYTYDAVTHQFHFLGSRHDATIKTVLGKTGNWSGDDVVNLILAHPSTAKYICKKLYEYFVHESPDEQTIERLARVLRENEYELRPMLRNLFLSEQFYSGQALASHVKNPVELLIGTVRVLGLKTDDYSMIDGAAQQQGMTLFEPPNVAGWEDGRAWVNENRILLRYNHLANIIERSSVDLVAAIEGDTFNSPAELVDHLIDRCLVIRLDQSKRQALIAFAADIPPSSQWAAQKDRVNPKLRALVLMIMSTPEYQLS